MNDVIRLAESDDTAQILEIYVPIVMETTISFEVEPPSVEEMGRRLAATQESFPWLVSIRGGEILGYAYAARFRTRAAYDWSVETSVYVRGSARRQGVGRALYRSLFALLALQGFVNACAGIALPNSLASPRRVESPARFRTDAVLIPFPHQAGRCPIPRTAGVLLRSSIAGAKAMRRRSS